MTRGRRIRLAFCLMGAAALAGAVAAPRGADDRSASPARSGGKARPSRGPMAGMAIAGTTQACLAHEDCDDGQGCTAELCSDGVCLNPPIPDCISCMGVYICPPVEIVFVMDTSGSMRDEAAALCGGIEQLVTDLYGLGISVTPRVLGITEAPVDAYFSCLSSDVVTLFGGETPGLPESCAFPNTLSAYESWGPATAIVAEHFPWTFGSVRLVVPMSDEGPCDGSRPAGCNDPGDDRASIDNAISVALAGGVIVSPIAGTGSDACVVNLATAVANATGGIVLQSQNASLDLTDSITEIILNRCSFDDRCDDQHVCTTNDRCIDTVCVGTPIKDCQPCLSSSVCDDDDGCTNEECVEGMCVFTLTYDDSTECCAPATGTIAPLDDGDPCTLDSCDPLTGAPSHPPSPQGVTCVDGRDCTLDDRCDGQGQCAGDDAGTVECTSDADCFGFSCDPQTQRCSCGDTPELCLVAVQGALREEGCFTVDEPLSIDVRLGSSSHTIVGAQFLIEYDPAVLDLVQIEPGSLIDAQSPFTQEIFRSVNEHEGKLFYAVGVDLGGMGTRGPAILARLHFQPLEACTRDELCFLSQNPQRTILTNEEGHQVLFTTCCTGELSIHGTAPWLTCPLSRVVNADAGTLSATLGWAAPAATATCGAGPTLACSGDNTHGADVAHLISNGGRIPAGETAFHCSAEDDCGLTAACDWTITVEETNLVELAVQLSPAVSPGPLRRCIEFEFYTACFEAPVVVERNLEFGYPFNLPGRATSVLIEVPAGTYQCVAARDPKHTLRSVSAMQVQGGRYVAGFVGDPRAGGNWLIAGDLDGNGVINETDEALFQTQNGSSIPPQSLCGAPDLHADFNGDGSVDTADSAFIQRHFLATDAAGCCPRP